jgi:hypothetical protein
MQIEPHFLTPDLTAKLIDNGRRQLAVKSSEDEIDFWPVVKLFTPDAQCTWLLTEIDPRHPQIAFGLCDLGLGFPELGDVSLDELATVRGRLGLRIERDRHWTACGPLSAYAAAARGAQRIIDIEPGPHARNPAT